MTYNGSRGTARKLLIDKKVAYARANSHLALPFAGLAASRDVDSSRVGAQTNWRRRGHHSLLR